MIKNVSQFKKALKIGVKVKAIHHQMFAGRDENGKALYKNDDLGTRPISIVQTNSFALATERVENGNNVIVDSWCSYPKASESKVENGILTIYTKDLRQSKGGCMMEGHEEYDSLPLIPMLSYAIVM
jgi:hypothetical protein